MTNYSIAEVGSQWVLSRVTAQPFGGIATEALSSHDTQAQALVAKAKATGQRPPRKVSQEDFDRAVLGHTSKPEVWAAAMFIAVKGLPWFQTTQELGVSTASVSALLRRSGLR